ncbi:MAG: aminotransferase class IV, partial [Cyclobacteriaceae bacterium]
MFVSYNFQLIDEKEVCISAYDRSFLYGDGFFETIAYKNGEIRFLNDHFARMKRATSIFSIELNPKIDTSFLETAIQELIEKNNLSDEVKININVWRTEGGLYGSENTTHHILIRVVNTTWNTSPTPLNKVVFFDE